MKFGLSAVYGLVAGLAMVGLSAFALLRPAVTNTYKTTGLPAEYLAPGAARWRVVPEPPLADARLFALPGGKFAAWSGGDRVAVLDPASLTWTMKDQPVEPPPETPPSGATPIFWTPVSKGSALAAWYDDVSTGEARDHCQLYFEPAHTPLPKLPPACEKAINGAQLTHGAVLALAWDRAANRTRTYRLEPGAQAWTELGSPPEDVSGPLVPGEADRALYGNASIASALFENGAWRLLPKNEAPRYGYSSALADDGGVLVVGGQQDEAAGKTAAFALLPFLGFGLLLALAVVAKVKWKASLPGMATGCGVALLLAVAAFLLLLPSLAWH